MTQKEVNRKKAYVTSLFQNAVQRVIAWRRYKNQSEGKLQELITSLKRQNSFKLRKEAEKVEEVIKANCNTIMSQKIENLIIKQINQLQYSTQSNFELIQNISSNIKKMQDRSSQSSIGGYKRKPNRKKNY